MTQLWSVLTFQGRVGRVPCAGISAAVLALHHLAIEVVGRWAGIPEIRWLAHMSLAPPLAGDVAPHLPHLAALLLDWLCLVETLLVAWIVGALAYARATDAGRDRGVSALAVVPFLQIAAIAYLVVLPAQDLQTPHPKSESPPNNWAFAAQGVLTGGALSVVAVTIGALVFASYGWTMFLISPFLVGLTTAFLANRKCDVGLRRTFMLVFVGLIVGGLALLGFALEGVVCLVLASPLALGLGLLGGLSGRWAARKSRHPLPETAALFLILPLAFGAEQALPHGVRFEMRESREIAAPPSTVWRAVTHMGEIRTKPSLLFRLGLAYPTSGVIRGEGVGAIREGHFSTGVAYERVTEWSPGRRLTFDVLSDAPSLRELSPYPHVYAPHVNGYFRTRKAQFDFEPLPGGRTRLSLTTTHELNLNPAAYWGPIAKWVTHENKLRVLNHFARLSVRSYP